MEEVIRATKDIVVALINSKQIANYTDTDENIKDVCKAIEKIKQEFIKPGQTK